MRKIIIFVKNTFIFNWDKYWRRRTEFFKVKKNSIRYFYLQFYLKRQDRKQNADLGLDYDMGDGFVTPPNYNPHGLNGIVIAAGAQIGKNCSISHQVTIGRSNNGVPIIGDGVYIGPGAKIFGDIHIGNNVRIGANCPVFFDVPDNATVVLQHPSIICKDADYKYFDFDPEVEVSY